eukprot:6137956-Pyramimonas_sp.AAC.1
MPCAERRRPLWPSTPGLGNQRRGGDHARVNANVATQRRKCAGPGVNVQVKGANVQVRGGVNSRTSDGGEPGDGVDERTRRDRAGGVTGRGGHLRERVAHEGGHERRAARQHAPRQHGRLAPVKHIKLVSLSLRAPLKFKRDACLGT